MQYIQKAFSLIELMIVVAIIGILAAVAIPAYQDYIARAQMAEVITVLGSLKSPVAAYYAENGTFPSKAELLSTGVVKLPTRYVADIIVATKQGDPDVLIIAAETSATRISDKIKSKVVSLLTPDGGKTWYCHRWFFLVLKTPFPPDFLANKEFLSVEDEKYLPPNCRGGLAALQGR